MTTDSPIAAWRPAVHAPATPLPDLPLAELREYRARLRDEDDRVSYWRRLVHARLDLLHAGSLEDGVLSLEKLVLALGDTATGRRREALHRVRAFDPLPELPVLHEMWDTPGPGSPEGGTERASRLEAAADQLSRYRAALHARIDAATAELIERYRRDPASALAVLQP
jgi:hypothetical protein